RGGEDAHRGGVTRGAPRQPDGARARAAAGRAGVVLRGRERGRAGAVRGRGRAGAADAGIGVALTLGSAGARDAARRRRSALLPAPPVNFPSVRSLLYFRANATPYARRPARPLRGLCRPRAAVR